MLLQCSHLPDCLVKEENVAKPAQIPSKQAIFARSQYVRRLCVFISRSSRIQSEQKSFSTNGTLLKKARKHNSAHRYRKCMHLQPLISPYHILYYLPYSFIYSIPVRIRLEGLKSLCKKGNVAKLLLQLFPRSFRVNLFAEPSSLMNF